VLQHLIDNAIKFDNTGSPIVVRLARRQNLVWFSVEDSGRGIPVNLQDKIFEPFFQIDSSERRSAGGAGLGLALVTIILNKHNTEIKLKSEPGRGSIFSFALPILNLSP
jgi:signal transduction histidine kinase